MPDTTVGPGHNQPPADEQFETLRNRVDHLAEVGRRWADERPKIADEDQAKKASTFVAQIREALKAIEAARKDEKAPHIDAGRAVDQKWKPLAALLEPIQGAMGQKLTAWQVAQQRIADEARRKAEQEAAKRQAEADRLAAEAKTVEDQERAAQAAQAADAEAQKAKAIDSRTRSDTGQTTSLRKAWKFEITDPDKVPRGMCEPSKVSIRWHIAEFDRIMDKVEAGEISQLAATAQLKKLGFQGGRREIKGLRIYQEQTAVTRTT